MEIASSGSWSVGFMWAIGFLILAVLACIFFVFIAYLCRNDYPGIFVGGAGLSLLVAFIIAGSLFPWSDEYHQYREVSGHVAEIDARMVSTDNGMEEKFVVRFEGSNQEFRVDDTRGALIEPGGALTVKCIKTWDYNATDGYVCKWGEFTP